MVTQKIKTKLFSFLSSKNDVEKFFEGRKKS